MRSTATRFLGLLMIRIFFSTLISGHCLLWDRQLQFLGLFEVFISPFWTLSTCSVYFSMSVLHFWVNTGFGDVCVWGGGGGDSWDEHSNLGAQIRITLSSVNWKKATVPSRPRSGVGNKLQETRCIGGLRKWKGKGAAQGNTSNQLVTLAWFLRTTPR